MLVVAGATETPASATFTASACGTLTSSSATGNLATITAGTYYTNKVSCGTPLALSDLTNINFSFIFQQSGSAISIVPVPGFFVHYSIFVP